MNELVNVDNMLDAISGVLSRCFVIGIIGLTISVAWIMAVPDWAWQFHGKLFHISGEQVCVAIYSGLVVAKVGIFGLFLLPYIGIRMVLKKRKRELFQN